LYEFPQQGGKIVAVKLVNLEDRSNNSKLLDRIFSCALQKFLYHDHV